MDTPFSSRSFTKSILSCWSACIIACSKAPGGHFWPYIKISLRAISTRFHIKERDSCSAGDNCFDLNKAVNIVWSSSCDLSCEILNTVIYKYNFHSDNIRSNVLYMTGYKYIYLIYKRGYRYQMFLSCTLQEFWTELTRLFGGNLKSAFDSF